MLDRKLISTKYPVSGNPVAIFYNPVLQVAEISVGGTINTLKNGQVKGKDSSQLTRKDLTNLISTIQNVIHLAQEKNIPLKGICIQTGTDTGAQLGMLLHFYLNPILTETGIRIALVMSSFHKESPQFDGDENHQNAVAWVTEEKQNPSQGDVRLAVDGSLFDVHRSKRRTSGSQSSFEHHPQDRVQVIPEALSLHGTIPKFIPLISAFKANHQHVLRTHTPCVLGETTVVELQPWTTESDLKDFIETYLKCVNETPVPKAIIFSGTLTQKMSSQIMDAFQTRERDIAVIFHPTHDALDLDERGAVLPFEIFKTYPKDRLQLKADAILPLLSHLEVKSPESYSQRLGVLLRNNIYGEYQEIRYTHSHEQTKKPGYTFSFPAQFDLNIDLLDALLKRPYRIALGAQGGFNLAQIGSQTPEELFPEYFDGKTLEGDLTFQERLNAVEITDIQRNTILFERYPLTKVLATHHSQIGVYSHIQTHPDRFSGYAPEQWLKVFKIKTLTEAQN